MRVPEELSPVDRFLIYGVIIGGLLPVGVFWLADWFAPMMPAALRLYYHIAGATFVVVVFAAFALPRLFNFSERRVLGLTAVFSVICLNVFVVATGGPLVSLFSYHYLYIPVVVGYALGWRSLVQAAIGCTIAYVLALLAALFILPRVLPSFEKALVLMNDSPLYVPCYTGIFILQLFITCHFARRSIPADTSGVV